MSSFSLKLIAAITMAADHTGLILFPEAEWLRIVGRLSFPIFAFLIGEGYSRTGHVGRYLFRLGIFAAISQMPYAFALEAAGIDDPSLNIFFTLFAGLGAVIAFSKIRNIFSRCAVVALIAFLAETLEFDYGAYGTLLILALSFIKKAKAISIASAVAVTLLYTSLKFSAGIVLFQPISLLALLPILSYDGSLGIRISKWWFYAFYPIHLILLSILAKIG